MYGNSFRLITKNYRYPSWLNTHIFKKMMKTPHHWCSSCSLQLAIITPHLCLYTLINKSFKGYVALSVIPLVRALMVPEMNLSPGWQLHF